MWANCKFINRFWKDYVVSRDERIVCGMRWKLRRMHNVDLSCQRPRCIHSWGALSACFAYRGISRNKNCPRYVAAIVRDERARRMKIFAGKNNNNKGYEQHAGRGNEEIMQNGTRRGLGHRVVHPDSAGLAASTTPGSTDRSSSHAW